MASRLVQMTHLCWLRILGVPRGESWPGTCASSRGRIAGPSPCATTGNKQVVIVIVIIVASPARTSLRLPFDGRRFTALLAFNTSPANRTSIRIAQPLLQATLVEPMGAVSYLQEFVIGQIIIQADRTPLVATRSNPFTIFSGWKACYDMARSIPRFHFAQGRSEVRQTLK